MPHSMRGTPEAWIKKKESTGGCETRQDDGVFERTVRVRLTQNENSTHIGTFNVESRLSRRMYVAPLPSGMR